ncbi:glycoside hydrolase family 18 protein [Deminuibacter soli]|uniref:chitinase n=1 Tax=Deminuibacter soli TaxID=2291815 RepID=A0A3E1NLX7_9BACT|nr:glycoside hydrolase family 18 protein [Deminuibacter soli]RFM28901.1 glycoside hydrolase [Deminuibacter soli]
MRYLRLLLRPLLPVCLLLMALPVMAQKKKYSPAVIAYYAGDSVKINNYPVEKLTHLLFSFAHLQGNDLHLFKKGDTILLHNMVALKQRNPAMKVMISIGGWGGCATCSPVFSSDTGRKAFARSVKQTLVDFNADGIDLDWEYPTIKGFPGHPYSPADKDNFTLLVKELRKTLGKKYEISFAAGGFTEYLRDAVDWKKLTPYVNRINLMSYDLVSGFSTISGHHSPLYPNGNYPESVDHAVRWLDSIGVPRGKIAIGAAFYARIFTTNDTLNYTINRPAVFTKGTPYKNFDRDLADTAGFVYRWDDEANAPFRYNYSRRQFASFDDPASIKLKTQYVIDKRLNGIMFWQLGEDKESGGLLDVIDATKQAWEKKP